MNTHHGPQGHQTMHHEHKEHEKNAEHDVNHSDHGGHAYHAGMIEDYKKRFIVVLVLTIPIMALSPIIQHWLNVNWSFAGSSYVLMSLSSIVYFYGGWPFLVGLKDEVKSGSLL